MNLGYPIAESIQSISPFCDEIIINVGFDDKEMTQDDGTYVYLKSLFPNEKKYKFTKSYWDPALTSKGLVLAEQTNIALSKCQGKYCQYIQADEIIAESDIKAILASIEKMEQNDQIQGLVFNYTHFFGNVNIIKKTRNVYRQEVRLIRNHIGVKSWSDAQGFRLKNDQKLTCIKTDAVVYHYGWARKEMVMSRKVKEMDKLYHGSEFEKKNDFVYKRVWGLKKFTGNHPVVMQNWIELHKNDIDIFSQSLTWEKDTVKCMISDLIEKLTGYRIGEYKNFILIK